MSGAVTRLCVAAVVFSAATDYTKTLASASRPNDGTFTRLAPTGTAGQPWGLFTGKTATTDFFPTVFDTLRPVVSEGPFSNVDLAVSDNHVPVVNDARAAVGQVRGIADPLRAIVTDIVQTLTKSGSFPKTASDTIHPVVTEATSYLRAIAAADTLTPVVTDAKSALDKSAALTVADTITVQMLEEREVSSVTSARSIDVLDTITALVAERAVLRLSGDVDAIVIVSRPKGRIRLEPV